MEGERKEGMGATTDRKVMKQNVKTLNGGN